MCENINDNIEIETECTIPINRKNFNEKSKIY